MPVSRLLVRPEPLAPRALGLADTPVDPVRGGGAHPTLAEELGALGLAGPSGTTEFSAAFGATAIPPREPVNAGGDSTPALGLGHGPARVAGWNAQLPASAAGASAGADASSPNADATSS